MHNPFIAAQKFIYLSKHHLLVASSKFDHNKDKTWKVLKMASMTIEKIEPIVVSQSLKEPFYFSQWEYQSRTICLVKGTFINHVDTILGSLFSTFWPFLQGNEHQQFLYLVKDLGGESKNYQYYCNKSMINSRHIPLASLAKKLSTFSVVLL